MDPEALRAAGAEQVGQGVAQRRLDAPPAQGGQIHGREGPLRSADAIKQSREAHHSAVENDMPRPSAMPGPQLGEPLVGTAALATGVTE